MENLLTYFNNITTDQLLTGIGHVLCSTLMIAALAFFIFAIVEMEFDHRYGPEYRRYRFYSVVSAILWLVFNAVVGILVILMKKGIVSEFVDLHTPPARQIYILVSSIMLGVFAITLFLYIFKLRVIYKKRNDVPRNFKRVAKWFSLYTLGIASVAFAIIGVLAIMGIYDMSYKRGTALLFFTILFGIAIIAGLIMTAAYVMFRCGFSIVKDINKYPDGSFFIKKDKSLEDKFVSLYHFVMNTRSIFGRVYYVNEIAAGSEQECRTINRKKYPVAFVDELIEKGTITEITLDEMKAYMDKEKRDQIFKEKVEDMSEYYFSTYI